MILDRDLEALTVLSVRADTTPQLVYNLEVEGAHTYFAGELGAWAHNARRRTSGGHTQNRHVQNIDGKSTFCKPSGLPRLIQRAMNDPDRISTSWNGNTVFDKKFGRVIGRSSCGDPLSSIRVVIRSNGREVTAFPF